MQAGRELHVLALVEADALVPTHPHQDLAARHAQPARDVDVGLVPVVVEQVVCVQAIAPVHRPIPVARAVGIDQARADHLEVAFHSFESCPEVRREDHVVVRDDDDGGLRPFHQAIAHLPQTAVAGRVLAGHEDHLGVVEARKQLASHQDLEGGNGEVAD